MDLLRYYYCFLRKKKSTAPFSLAFLRKLEKGFYIPDRAEGEMQPLLSGMLSAEITPLPTLLTSLHISPGCVFVCICMLFLWQTSLPELYMHMPHTQLSIDGEFRWSTTKCTSFLVMLITQAMSDFCVCVWVSVFVGTWGCCLTSRDLCQCSKKISIRFWM